MIFWNVILVNHLYFVWAETEINVTFHFCRLRQSTREKYCEYKWVIFRVDKCMDTFCIRIFYYSISQGFYSTIFHCRASVSTWPWLSWYLSPLHPEEQYHERNFTFTRCQVKLQCVYWLVFIDNFYARAGEYFDADCDCWKCQCEYWWYN